MLTINMKRGFKSMEKGFRKAVIIFIDILGSQNRENFDDWYNIMRIFSESVNREKDLDRAHSWTIYKREIHVFSDCAYIIYDYKEGVEEDKKNMNALMCIACYNTEKVIYKFLENEFLARGAITYGDIYYDNEKNIWFGPGMNKAYSLENKKARFPRIIIDPEYVHGLIEYNEKIYRDSEINRVTNREIIKKDKDGIYYLNYLNSIPFIQDADKTATKILWLCENERHKERKSEKDFKSIKEKYDWLENYLKDFFEIEDVYENHL